MSKTTFEHKKISDDLVNTFGTDGIYMPKSSILTFLTLNFSENVPKIYFLFTHLHLIDTGPRKARARAF